VLAAAQTGKRQVGTRYNARCAAGVNAVTGIEVVDIAHAIELALAPVFLLSGVGVYLGVLTNRLARVVDRARNVEKELRQHAAADETHAREQLRAMARRARFMNLAITLATIAGLLIALVVALVFASTFVPINLAVYVAVLFVTSMVSLIGAFICFLVEVRIAVAALRIGAP
jgi:CBS domain containing-hemolysin-like protein